MIQKTTASLLLEITKLSDRQRITFLYFLAIGSLIYVLNVFFTKDNENDVRMEEVYKDRVKNLRNDLRLLKIENKELYNENKELYKGKLTKLDTLVNVTQQLLKNKSK